MAIFTAQEAALRAGQDPITAGKNAYQGGLDKLLAFPYLPNDLARKIDARILKAADIRPHMEGSFFKQNAFDSILTEFKEELDYAVLEISAHPEESE